MISHILELSEFEGEQLNSKSIGLDRASEDIAFLRVDHEIEPFVLDQIQMVPDLIQRPKLDRASMSRSLPLSTCETLRGNVSNEVFDNKTGLFS